MIITAVPIGGAYVIDIDPREDDRGFFARLFCEQELAAHDLDTRVSQCNVAWNRLRGTLRGMHYQAAPHEETKHVRCTRGAIWDVILDVRAGSPTFGRWHAVELTAANHRTLYVPRGIAHGYLTLTDDAEVSYLVSEAYAPQAARGIRWNDPAFAIDWPFEPVVISAADASHADWR
jgi:dTDP-4-dehydrorhamnose 3,5-epimerase